MKGLSTSVGDTSVIFGFFRQVLSLAKEFHNTKHQFVFVWDSNKNLRKMRCSGYKDREKPEQTLQEKKSKIDAYKQFELLKTKLLKDFGFKNIFWQIGYEADDVIASICKDNEDRLITIVSSDNDLWQLLTPKHWMYDIKKKKYYRDVDFKEQWGIEPEKWATVKAIAGCSTDNVSGICGVGYKTACKYIRGLLRHGIIYDRIVSRDGESTVFENSFFVQLPLVGVHNFKIQENEIFYVEDFLSICDRYDFRSFKRDETTWMDCFSMQIREREKRSIGN